MPGEIKSLLDDYVKEIKGIYGSHLKRIVLYGSYARGDFTDDSDVDIMILVDLPDENIDEYLDALCSVDFDYSVEHDICMQPVVVNSEHFYYWHKVHAFYANVVKDGVVIYEAA